MRNKRWTIEPWYYMFLWKNFRHAIIFWRHFITQFVWISNSNWLRSLKYNLILALKYNFLVFLPSPSFILWSTDSDTDTATWHGHRHPDTANVKNIRHRHCYIFIKNLNWESKRCRTIRHVSYDCHTSVDTATSLIKKVSVFHRIQPVKVIFLNYKRISTF
jgi:hypothetical protein